MGKKVVLLFLLLLIPLVSAFDFPSDDLTVNTYTGTLTNLSEMEDTNIPAPSNNEVLSWSEATGMWIAKAVAGITDYFTQAEILGFGYYNLTDFDIADYYTSSEVDDINTSMENYIGVVNTSMKNYVDSIGTGDANWDAVFNATLLIVDTEINTSMKNYVDYVNSTNFQTDTDTFVANYSTFLTHVSEGTIWTALSNGTMVLTSVLNNGTYSAVDTDTFVANYSLVVPYTILNNGTYSAVDTDTFVANYSEFLTHVTEGEIWKELSNGTMVLTSVLNNGTYSVVDTDTWADNYSSYSTTAEILAFGYYNSTDFVITDYFTKSDVLGFSYYNSTDFDIEDYYTSSEVEGVLNNGTYIIDSILNNGTYSAVDTDTFVANYSTFISNNESITNTFSLYTLISELVDKVGNWTLDKVDYYTSSEVDDINTSIVNYVDYVNSTNFQIDTDTFVTNYSVFLTHVTLTELNNGTYIIDSILNNGSYFNIAETDSLAYNGTLVDYPTLNNGTYSAVDTDTFVANYSLVVPYTILNNGTYITTDGEIWTIAGNGTLVEVGILNNGTYSAVDTDTFVANYSDYLNTKLLTTNNTFSPVSEPLSLHLNQDNWFNDSNGYINWDGDSPEFNQTKLEVSYFDASALNVVTGTGAGNLEDIQTYNRVSYNVTEANSDYELIVNFTEIEEFTTLLVRHKVDVVDGHSTAIQLWDYSDSVWEGYGFLSEQTTSQMQTLGVYDDSEHIEDGVVQVRFYQEEVGNAGHIHQFDWVGLSKGFGTPVGTETDPLSIHRDGATPLTANWDEGGFNLTSVTSWFLGIVKWENVFGLNTTIWNLASNGTLATSEELNNGTYTTSNSDIWDIAGNGTLVEVGILNNGTYSAVDTDTWVANYSSYYTSSEVEGVLNNGTYVIDSVLNNGTYSAVDTDTFVANYSEFLTHVTEGTIWTALSNGTMVLTSILNNGTYSAVDTDTWVANYSSYLTTAEILAFGYYNSTDFVITDYFTKSDVLGFSYYNSTDFSIADYFTKVEVLAFDYYNSTDFDINDYLPSATILGFNYYNSTDFSISDYYTKTQIDNFNYYNLTDFNINDYYTSSEVGGVINNGTYIIDSILNNGTYSAVDTDTFVANYSQFILNNESITNTFNLYTLISELVDKVGNWTLDKVDYYTSSEVDDINTSMANYVLEVNATNFQVDTDTFVANYSTFLTHVPLSVLNNGTYSIGDTDTFVANYSDYLDIQDLVTNNTFAQLTVLNNGTYSAVDTDTFVANYSTFLTHATTTYVDAQNTSQTNLINLNNESMGNYVLEVNATNFQIDTDTFVANYSVFLTHVTLTELNNGTYIIDSVLNNGTYSAVDTDTFVANYSLVVPYTVLNNGTYSAVDTDTFVANYSVFLTHATTTYVDTQNTSQTNYIGVQNTSIVNWVSNVFNVTRNNYVDAMDLIFNNSVVNWVNDIFYTKTEVNAINTSMSNYVDFQNTSQTNYIGTVNTSMKNYVDYVNSTNPTDTNTNAETICSGALYLAGNGTCTTDLDTDTTYSDLSEFNDDIGVSADWDEIGDVPTATPSDSDTTHLSTADQIYDWVIGLAYATTTYVNVQNSSVVNWVNDIFYTKTEVDAINTSMKNYVDDTFLTDVVSDTTPQLGGDLYANNHDIALNDSDKLYFGNSKDISCNFDGTDFIWTQEVGSPQFKIGGNLNMSVNNVTSVDCILFKSGGKICDSS